MAESDIRRNFNMSNAELSMFASNLVSVLTRDLSDMATFGVDAAAITAFQTLGNQFEIFPSDDFMLGDLMIATEAKNAKKEELKEATRLLAVRVEAKWGANSAHYSKLRITGMNEYPDTQLIGSSRNVLLTMNGYLLDLAAFGLTQAILDSYDDLIQEFEVTLNQQSDAISNRDTKKKERTDLGNQLYEQVTRFCNFGKILYERTNPAKYNDYVIYGSSSPSVLTPVANFAYSWTETDFTWDAVVNATSYQVEESADQATWTEIYAGENNIFSFTPSVSGTLYYRCRARNSGGYGDFSSTISIEFLNVLPAPQNLQVAATGPSGLDLQLTWDLVPTAISYWPYRSVVALGAPAGSFSYQGLNVPTNSWNQTVEAGHRYYYKIKAANPLRESAFSDIVFVDVP